MNPTVTRPVAERFRDVWARIHRAVLTAATAGAAWDRLEDGPRVAAEVGLACQDLLELRHDVLKAYHAVWHKFFTADVPEPAEAGKVVFAVWDSYIAALGHLQTTATAMATLGFPVPGA